MSGLTVFSDDHFMKVALREAERALEEDEIPVGAVIVCQNKVIAKGYNHTEKLTDVTAHAEMLAITSAENYLSSKYLTDCTLYVTLEPCVMCAGALHWTQISRIVYGASDLQRGYSLLTENVLHPKTKVQSGVLENECRQPINVFFKRLRGKE
ncbi:MAG: nucleoside deaminase [Imperialibacter sp.]